MASSSFLTLDPWRAERRALAVLSQSSAAAAAVARSIPNGTPRRMLTVNDITPGPELAQPFRKPAAGAQEPRAHAGRRHPAAPGDLPVAEAEVDAQDEQLLRLGRQPAQGLGDRRPAFVQLQRPGRV